MRARSLAPTLSLSLSRAVLTRGECTFGFAYVWIYLYDREEEGERERKRVTPVGPANRSAVRARRESAFIYTWI